jgi:catechol 2,3-dioxygenase-like lactoylglutathione lyase family enzyme
MSRILGPAIHQAYVFPDFDAALARFAALGIGPFYVLHSESGLSRFRGEMRPVGLSAAFVYSGDACFEIITPVGEQQSSYSEFLQRNPAGGLHHIAYYSSDFNQTLTDMAAEGQPVVIVQEFTDAEGNPFEIYCEPEGIEGAVQFQLIKPGLFDRWFDAMREEAAQWDGQDPIRDARPLMAASMGR